MDYATLTKEDRVNGYKTRIGQLEREYFDASVGEFEANIIGLTKQAKDFSDLMKSIELRISALNELIEGTATNDTNI